MNTTGTRGHSAPSLLLSSGTSFLLGTCGVVATAAYLGVNWLREPVLGLPAGVWTIALVQAAGTVMSRRFERGTSVGRDNSTKPESALTMIAGRAAGAAWEGVRAGAKALRVNGERFQTLEDHLAQRTERSMRRAGPIRIGLDAGPETRRILMEQPTSVPIVWGSLSPSQDDQATLRRFRLDATFSQPSSGPTRVVTVEHPEREASWYDWALPRPLTYAAVFPLRVDITQLTLEQADLLDPKEAMLVGALVRAAAALSRTPGRLRLSDRLCGRLPSAATNSNVRTPTGPADRAMLELIDALKDSQPTIAAKAAARATSAWLATTDVWLDINLRRQGIENALRILGEEPEVLLRAAAIRLAMFEDDLAFEAIKTAERVIRSGKHEQMGEHLAFLQAELELGLPNPLTLGRVAAGVCMVCASSPRDRVAFIRGDIMDDVRHSAWLIGREQDRAVLSEVFKLMGADRVSPGPWELRDAA